MKPILAIPLHDPNAVLFPILQVVADDLKSLFDHCFLSISPKTKVAQADLVAEISSDPFFTCVFNYPDTLPGEHFMNGWRHALAAGGNDRVYHLCDSDRLAFALNLYRADFLHDFAFANAQAQPVLYQRSPMAWASHPLVYQEIEGMVNRVGELAFGRKYDFAWSHIVVRGDVLQHILDNLKRRDFAILAEIVLLLRDELILHPVDWLSWEDPWVQQTDADMLRAVRDNSLEETKKRLRGLLPFFNVLLDEIEPLTPNQTWDRALHE